MHPSNGVLLDRHLECSVCLPKFRADGTAEHSALYCSKRSDAARHLSLVAQRSGFSDLLCRDDRVFSFRLLCDAPPDGLPPPYRVADSNSGNRWLALLQEFVERSPSKTGAIQRVKVPSG